MTIVHDPKSDLPRKLSGLHLFHYGGAPCAQRVRLVLAEKGVRRGPDVPWQSDAPAHLVASRNDPYCDYQRAEDLAGAWGATFQDAGEAGHINVESGHGPWPEGMMSFAHFMKRLG